MIVYLQQFELYVSKYVQYLQSSFFSLWD